MANDRIRIGVLGCGGFGLFALQHFAQHPEVELVAMAGTHREAAYAAAQRFGIPEPGEVEDLCAGEDVDLVYIATPPFLHHPQALMALRHGKHVICEKPLALNIEQADEMVAAARENDQLLVANLMQRYNPLFDMVGRLVDGKVLGEPLHAYFENYATDEGLPAEHWFWDRAKSGGILIEHGVHFFDLFQGWFGPGQVEAAQAGMRPGTSIEDQVQCTVRFGEAVRVNFYHAFTQVGRMDRQEMRILFERGDVTLYDWIPSRVRVHAVADEAQTRQLMDLFPGARLDVLANYPPKDRAMSGRHKSLDIYQMVDLYYGESHDKMVRYGECLRALLDDQVRWIRDRGHQRRVTDKNGRDSLALACEADRLAHGEKGRRRERRWGWWGR